MRIRTTIIVTFITVSIVAAFAGAYTHYLNAEAILEKHMYAHLESVAESRATHIETLLELEKETIKQLSESIIIEQFLLASKDDEGYTQRLNSVTRRLEHTAEIGGYTYDVFVLDKKGVIVASSDEGDTGKNRSDDPYFLGGKQGAFIKDAYVSKDKKIDSLAFSAPVFDEEGIVFLGVVVIRFSMDKLDEITTDRTGLGETGEIYLINKDGYMITPSRVVNDTFLKQKVDTENVRSCFEHKEHVGYESTTPFTNYVGVKALGTHVFIEEMNWCLLAEISEAATLGAQRNDLIKTYVFGTTFLIVLSMGLVGFIVSRLVSKPIEDLTGDIDAISRGNFKVNIRKSKIDEVNELAESINRVTTSMKLAIRHTSPVLEKERDELRKALEEKNKAEEELNESQRYTRELIETSLDPLVTISPEGKITDVNHATELVTGCPREKLIGTDFSNYFTEPEKARQGYQQVFKEGHVRDYPLEIKHQDGKTTPVLYNASVYHDTKGDVAGVFAAARDITERKHVEETLNESQRYTRELIETSLDPLVTISPEGKITDVNRATELVTGCPREKLIGTDFSDYFTDPEKARQGYQQVFKEGHVRDYPLEIKHQDGKTTHVLYNASVYHDTKGDVAGVFAAARDITERKQVDEKRER